MKYQKIYIEISNICNLQCSFCPEVLREKKVMGAGLFREILKQAAPLAQEICLHLMGEPLTHPHFRQVVESCTEEGVKVNLTTNGLLLPRYPQDTLLQDCFRQINFSLHSFKDNFGNKDITPYLEKILKFSQMASQLRPDLYINYRLWNMPTPEGQHASNREILRVISDFFQVPLLNLQVDARAKKSQKITGRIYLHFDTEFSWPSPLSPIRGQSGFCHGLSSHLGILADGTVVPCCLDKEANVALGKVPETGLVEVLQGERARKMREGFQKNRLVEDLCQRCTFIGRFDKKRGLTQIPGRGGPHPISHNPLST